VEKRFVDFALLQTASIPLLPAILYILPTNKQPQALPK
jgi:hypothetical protein